MDRGKLVRYRNRFLGICMVLLALALAWSGSLRQAVSPASGTGILSTGVSTKPSINIRVGTFNIHRAKGTDGRRDIGRIADILRGSDLIALQEVSAAGLFDDNDQAADLGEQLDMGWLFAPTTRRWFRDHSGNGLLSRFPVGDWQWKSLVKTSGKYHHNLVSAELTIGTNRIQVLVTHIDRRTDREAQLREVIKIFLNYDTAILLGDLNTRQSDPLVNQLIRDGKTIDALQASLGAADPEWRVDWILVRGFDVLDGGRSDVSASDHPYYWVELKVADQSI